MAELVITWDYFERNTVWLLIKARKDDKIKKALENLRELDPIRFQIIVSKCEDLL